MRSGHASRTAEHNALFRAMESSRPAGRRAFDDPLARKFLSWPLNVAGYLARTPGTRDVLRTVIDHRWPGVRSSVVARTLLIDRWVGNLIGDGATQVVILGAGYDTRAHRLPGLGAVAVYEVDHPDTQRAKREVLERATVLASSDLHYVANDFSRDDLTAGMAAAGYNGRQQTVFIWEGVTNYLSADAVDTTLRWVSTAAPGGTLIFTYVHRDVLTNPAGFAGADRLLSTLTRAGEGLTWGKDPEAMPEFLKERGLSLRTDIGAAHYRPAALGEAAREICGHEFYRLAAARIGWASSGNDQAIAVANLPTGHEA